MGFPPINLLVEKVPEFESGELLCDLASYVSNKLVPASVPNPQILKQKI